MNPRQLWTTPESDGCAAYCVRVTSPRLPLTALAATAALALLTGCTPEPAVPTAPPAATAEPLFATDEEALAAAEAAFEEYLRVAFEVFASGGENAETLETVATDEVLGDDLERAEQFREQGLRQTGEPVVLESALQQHYAGDVKDVEVTIYSCLVGDSVDVVDGEDRFVGNPDRESTVTIENIFVSNPDGKLLLSRSSVWKDGPECDF